MMIPYRPRFHPSDLLPSEFLHERLNIAQLRFDLFAAITVLTDMADPNPDDVDRVAQHVLRIAVVAVDLSWPAHPEAMRLIESLRELALSEMMRKRGFPRSSRLLEALLENIALHVRIDFGAARMCDEQHRRVARIMGLLQICAEEMLDHDLREAERAEQTT